VSTIPPKFLPAEYQTALARLQRIDEALLLSGAGGMLLTVGSAAYVLGNRANLNLGYAWAGPVPFLVAVAVLLALFAWRVAARRQVSALRRQAGIPEPPPSPYAPLFHRLIALPASGLLVLYGLTLLYSLRVIYSASRAAGSAFGVIFALLSALAGLAGLAVWRMWREQAPLTPGEVRQVVLPYPADLLAGSGLLIAGFLIPPLTMGLNASQLPIINALFRRNVDFTTSVPLAAIAALGLAYWVVIEFLLLPAVRMARERAEGQEGAQLFGYAHLSARLGLALVLAFLLGGLPLLILAGLICAQQAVAAWIAHPAGAARSPTRARFFLLWGGLLAPLRFFTGALAWVGPAWTFTLLLLLFCGVAFLAVGWRAARLARSARVLVVRGEEAPAYDLHSAPLWQHAGFLAAGLTLLGLIGLQAQAEDCGFFNAYLAAGYGRCNNALVYYRQAGLLNGFLLTFDLLVLGLLACAGVVRLLRKAGPALMMWITRVRTGGFWLLLAAALGLVIASFSAEQPSLALGGLLSGAVSVALWAER